MPRHHSKLNAWLIISKQQCEKSSSRCGILFSSETEIRCADILEYKCVGIPCSDIDFLSRILATLIDRQDFNLDLIMVRWTRRCSAAAENVPKASPKCSIDFCDFLFPLFTVNFIFHSCAALKREFARSRKEETIKINYEKQWKKSLIVAEDSWDM